MKLMGLIEIVRVLGCLASCYGDLARSALDWSPVPKLLAEEVALHSFPGAVALVAPPLPALPFTAAVGRQRYEASRPMLNSTLFDLASLTKVLATTTAAMLLYQRGALELDSRVTSLLGPGFAVGGKAGVTVRNLLRHNSGFPPDPTPQFWSPAFGCEQTGRPQPGLSFDCVPKIFQAVLAQPLENPVGSKYVYSDLSMITLMFVIGRIVQQSQLVPESSLRPDCMGSAPGQASQCHYEAFVRSHVFDYLGMESTGFLPPPFVWPNAAPACVNVPNATAYRKCPMQGEVSDGNAFAAGGISGHAGVFSTAQDIYRLMKRLLLAEAGDSWINKSTVKLFTTVQNSSQSSRALGWDTNDYSSNTYRGCGNLSSLTFTHTGYTGTQVCCDPTRGLVTILLTNRCYPDDSSMSKMAVHRARQRFNNAVLRILDSQTAD